MEPLESFSSPSQSPPDTLIQKPRRLRFQLVATILFGVAAFFFFLMMKLPEARIQNFVVAHLRILAQEQGLLFSAEKVKLSFITGPALKFYNVDLRAIDNERQTLKIPFVRIRPMLLSLLTRTKKASISAELLEGELSGAVGASPTTMFANLDVDSLDIGKAPLLKRFTMLELTSGVVSGEIKLDLDYEAPQSSNGNINLKIDRLGAPAQTLMGFNLPKLNITESKINMTIADGQLAIREFNLGSDPKNDDIVASITGTGRLDRSLLRTQLNAKARFRLSPSLTQSFPLLDAILARARTPDGSYAYRLSGPLMALEPQPGQ